GVNDQVVGARDCLDAKKERISAERGTNAVEHEIADRGPRGRRFDTKASFTNASDRPRIPRRAPHDGRPDLTYEIQGLGDPGATPPPRSYLDRVTRVRIVDRSLNGREILRHTDGRRRRRRRGRRRRELRHWNSNEVQRNCTLRYRYRDRRAELVREYRDRPERDRADLHSRVGRLVHDRIA